jgi:5-keto-L-gluconate epimerase
VSEKNIFYTIALGDENKIGAPRPLSGDLEQNIIIASEIGYDAVELHNIKDPKLVDKSDLLKICKKYNIFVSAISTGLSNYIDKLSLIDDSEKIRLAAIDRVKDYINLADQLNCAAIIGTLRGNIPDLSNSKYYKDKLIDSIKSISCQLKNSNVIVLIEIANRYEANYLNTAKEINDLINEINIPNLKMMLDTFHMNIEEVNICSSIKNYKEKLGYFHVADSNRLYPGAGHIDFSSIFLTLKKIKYKGYVGLECLPVPDGITAARKNIKFLKRFLEDK